MNLPNYHFITLKSPQAIEVKRILNKEMNMRHPVAINLKSFSQQEQRSIASLIEQYFHTHNISFKFPYPIYLICDLDSNMTNLPTCKEQNKLPRLFTQKDSKMNVKEMQQMSKNRLMQQEIINSDAVNNEAAIETFATFHRAIYKMEVEQKYYQMLLNKLKNK